MDKVTIYSRLCVARDTESHWNSANPILLEGEVAYSSDRRLHKVGDGTSRWRDLEYASTTSMIGATANADGVGGIVPKPLKDGYNTKYLRADGTWVVPPDTTYNDATESTHGLMSTSDKTKLDSIASGAQVNTVTSVAGKTGAVTLVKGDVGLGNVDNTADSAKSVAYATNAGTVNSHTVETDVPSGAVFTDTTYSDATTTTHGLMSTTDKSKLNGIESGAEVNQNAFSTIKVGSTNVAADAKTDTLTLEGSNVTITPDATNDKVTIGITKTNVTDALGYTPPTSNTTYNNATTSVDGLLSATDKSKLDGIASGAEVNQNAFSIVKIGANEISADGKTDTLELAGSNVTLTPDATNDKVTIGITKDNVTAALGYTPPTNDTTYNDATTSVHGLMSTSDKSKLDGIAAGAEVNVQSDWNASSGDALILNKPTLGSAAAKDVASSGNASSTQVVMGNDSRLSDSRPASDVSSWAKAASKPSYTASEVGAIASTAKGAANGVAELDANGLVPSSQLPSYVDDILEYTAKANFPTTGETGKIYVDTTENLTYRWSGTAYVEISKSLALGTTSSTAFRGDYGSSAYAHAVTNKGSAFTSGFYKITTNAEGHVTGATAVVKSDITGLGIPGQDTTYSAATTSADGLMSSTDKTKLNGIATGAEVNQNAFSTIKVGTTEVAADGKTDTLELAGSNVTLTPDTTNDKVTIGITKDNVTAALGYTPPTTNTTYSNATTSAAGLMSSSDKSKLDGIAAGAQVNTVTSVAGKTGAVSLTSSDVGLGNVGNFKAVSTVASQGLSSTEQSNARANIGAGTSSFDGAYSSLSGKPTLGTAAAKDVASSGNASSSQVVMGNDTRLSDARSASDVYSWAKAASKPSYTASEIGLGNVENKSSATIRSEITSSNVITALGYTPKVQVSTTQPSYGCTWFKITNTVTT